MSNIAKAFAHGKEFIPFITCGDPDLETTAEIVRAMARAGADLIELGIPFSDPTAEGPVIQAANVRALAAGTDAIVLVSADPSQLKNQLQDAFDAGIPVFGCDSGYIEGMQVNATSDNYQMGQLIVSYLFDDLMGGKGTVVALTHRPHPGVVKRCEAFDDQLKTHPDSELITEQHVPAEQPINDAQDIVQNLLTANPEKGSITAIFCGWDEPAIGAAQACAEAGRDEILIVGVDGNDQAVSLIQQGTDLKATVAQNFQGMTDIVADQLCKLFAGETIQPGELYADATLITADNADQFGK